MRVFSVPTAKVTIPCGNMAVRVNIQCQEICLGWQEIHSLSPNEIDAEPPWTSQPVPTVTHKRMTGLLRPNTLHMRIIVFQLLTFWGDDWIAEPFFLELVYKCGESASSKSKRNHPTTTTRTTTTTTTWTHSIPQEQGLGGSRCTQPCPDQILEVVSEWPRVRAHMWKRKYTLST